MPAPPNDNFANFTPLTKQFDNFNASNIGATAEPGEPANHGKTIWYRFLTTKTRPVFFSTLYVNPIILDKPLKTELRAFVSLVTSGVTFGTLGEMVYFAGRGFTSRYGGWDYGSYIAFNAVAGTPYYIRVDGLNGDEGNFPFSYGDFSDLRLGPCESCPPVFDPHAKCLGTVRLTDSTNPQTLSFGNIPAGNYVIAYCGGAILYNAGDGTYSVHIWDGTFGPRFVANYVNGGVQHKDLSNLPVVKQYANIPDTEAAFRCASVAFAHKGGIISLDYTDNPYADNANITPLPSFSLYQTKPDLSAEGACARWVVKGTSVTCDFIIRNNNPAFWDNITATLQVSGGISAPSTVTGFAINPLDNNRLTLTFNATTPNVTATVILTSPEWGNPITLTWFLGPIYVITADDIGFGSPICTSRSSPNLSIGIHNQGYFQNSATATLSFTNGVVFSTGSPACTPLGASITTATNIDCQGQQFLTPSYSRPSPRSTVLTISIDDGGINYGTFSFPFTTP